MSLRPTPVTFVLPDFAGGGAERVVLTLLGALDRQQYLPSLITFNNSGPLRDLLPVDVPVTNLERPRLRKALIPLLRTIRATRPAVVFSTFGYVNLGLLAFRNFLPAAIRLIIREANLPSISLAENRHRRLMQTAYRRLYKRADRVIATSQRMADEFRDDFGISPPKAHVLLNPVDLQSIRAACDRRPAIGPGLNLAASGRLTRQKGFDRLIDMMPEFPAGTHLTILGEGPDRAELERRIARLGLEGRAQIMGFTAIPWPVVAGADAFVLPSRWEGLPNTALEALACGTPVIATPEAGGIAEVAARAEPGSVTVAAAGKPFIEAVKALAPAKAAAGPAGAPRDSLLPEEFHLANVARAYENLFADTLGNSVRTSGS